MGWALLSLNNIMQMEIFLYGRESPRGRLEAVFGDKMATAKTQTVQT